MLTSRLSILETGLILFVLGFAAFVLIIATLGSGAGRPTVIQSVPGVTRVPVTPEEVQENWEKLAETINSVREKQALADAVTDPVKKERLQGSADELQKQAEALRKWLDSHEAVIPEKMGRMICSWCTKPTGESSGMAGDSHGVCDQCLKSALQEIEQGKGE